MKISFRNEFRIFFLNKKVLRCNNFKCNSEICQQPLKNKDQKRNIRNFLPLRNVRQRHTLNKIYFGYNQRLKRSNPLVLLLFLSVLFLRNLTINLRSIKPGFELDKQYMAQYRLKLKPILAQNVRKMTIVHWILSRICLKMLIR